MFFPLTMRSMDKSKNVRQQQTIKKIVENKDKNKSLWSVA